MICKWCGAEIQRSEKRCSRCGKENAPLSDCGGFYDLVPQAAPAAGGRGKKDGSAVVAVLLAVMLVVVIGFSALLMLENRSLRSQLKKQNDKGSSGVSWNGSTDTENTAEDQQVPEKDPFEIDLVKKDDETGPEGETGTETLPGDDTQPGIDWTQAIDKDE